MNKFGMEDNTSKDEIEIDLGRLFLEMKKYWKLIVISTLSLMMIAVLVTMFFIPKKYASETRVYLTPKVNESTGTIDNSSVAVNNSLVNSYMKIMTGNNILQKVADKVDMTLPELQGCVSVSNDTGTQLILIKATTKDPELSKKIAEQIVKVFTAEMQEKLNLKNITVTDYAQLPEAPVSPSKVKNGILGAAVGLIISCGYVFLKFILDKRLRNKDEAESYLGIPVLAEIPWFED